MKRHVNLMSNRARMQSMLRTRMRQWAIAYTCVVTLLAPLLFAAWWPVHQKGQTLAVLEAQCEPIRQQKIASRAFKEQIEQVHAKEHAALALVKIDVPVVTLLGLVSQAVASSHERVAVKQLKFSQDTTLHDDTTTSARPSIELAGYGLDRNAVNLFTSSLQAAFPFGKIELDFSVPEKIQQLRVHRFVIHCLL